ncbi:kinase-like protein [Ceratobasidium sp. AG-I]|nr:kinase-like protein [Ceratobasidium sp. AG-I]
MPMPDLPPRLFHLGITSSGPDERTPAENRWVSYQPYLLSKGYELRPRYRQDWVPSWNAIGQSSYGCEDRGDTLALNVLDATRVEDGRRVAIKLLLPSPDDRDGVEELEILQRFSSEPFRSDPTNHTVTCVDSFPIPDVPGGVFIVTPLLSKYNHPEFWDLSEVHDFLQQIFEGLEFLHKHDVAHCDIASPNVMMDGTPLYDESFHPFYQNRTLDGKRPLYAKYLRSQRPVRYFYIDFGYAKWFRDPNEPRMVVGFRAREQTPEQITEEPYDPFKADIFQLGAIIRRDLIPKIPTLDFLLPLARAMTETDPSKRPSLARAKQSMHTQFVGLSEWKKRWPIIPPNTSLRRRFLFCFAGFTTELIIFLGRIVRLVILRKW